MLSVFHGKRQLKLVVKIQSRRTHFLIKLIRPFWKQQLDQNNVNRNEQREMRDRAQNSAGVSIMCLSARVFSASDRSYFSLMSSCCSRSASGRAAAHLLRIGWCPLVRADAEPLSQCTERHSFLIFLWAIKCSFAKSINSKRNKRFNDTIRTFNSTLCCRRYRRRFWCCKNRGESTEKNVI